jgi:hypothetical protein
MDTLKITIPIDFVSLGKGSKLRSKQMKAKPVLRLLGDERLYFMNSCEGLEEIYTEMEKFTGTSEDAHDDIVSAISLLVEQFISYADMDGRINSFEQDYVSNKQEKAAHDLMYCLGKYAKFSNNDITEENPTTTWQIQQANQMAPQEPYFDPLQDVFK